MLISAALVLVIFSGPPPTCERLEPPIVTWAATLDEAVAKAITKAAKRGADTLYVIKTEPRGGYQWLKAGAMRCSAEGSK